MKHPWLLLGSLAFYVGAAGCELLFLTPFLDVDFPHLFPYVYFHLLGSLLFAFSGCLWFKAQKNTFHIHFFSFLFLSYFCFSFLALIGILLFLLLALFFPPSKQDFKESEEFEEELSQFWEILPVDKLSEDIRETVHSHLEIEPYVDILKGYDEELKKGALEQLAKMKTEEAVRLIQMALRDGNPEIRYTASLKLKKIEDEFSEQIGIVKEKLKREKTKENHNLLGGIYSQFCRMNLLDPVTQDYYYKLALNEYVISLQIDSKQPLILKSLAENYFAIHRLDHMLEIVNKALDLDPQDCDLWLMRCEANLQLGHWNNISQDCKRIQVLKKTDSDTQFYFKGLLEYWV